MILRAVSPVFSRNSALNLRAITLAKQFDLSAAYDTHYLALAERKECPLWTADTRMWRAVKDQFDWVHWIGDYAAP
jgi:predicted nucleic acid-binding protein